MPQEPKQEKLLGPTALHFETAGDHPGLAPWTEIEEGRFMPRRVRGSNLGRALG